MIFIKMHKNLFISTIISSLINFSILAINYESFRPGYEVIHDASKITIESYRNQEIFNWAENVRFRPEIVFVPKSKVDLIAIVKQAQEKNKRITMIGKGHSWNPLMEGSDYLISTVSLNQVWVHAENETVTVEAGATIDHVDKVIEQYGFMVPCNIVGTTDITYGGIMATGSHGSGVNCVTMSDFIQEIEFIKSNGESEIVSEATHGSDVMNAARLNLGLFGIMYKIKFKVQKAFNVSVTDYGVPMDTLFEVLPDYLRNHENVEVLWFPMTDRAIIKSWNPTDKPEHPGPLKQYIETNLTKWMLYKGFTPAIKCFMGNFPECIPLLADSIGQHLFPNRSWVQNVNDAIHYVNDAVVYPINETEIAIPYDFDDLSNVEMGWNAMVKAVYDNDRKGKHPLNVIVHMRFLRASNAILSPSYNNRRTCYMDYGSYYKTPGWLELVNEIWATWKNIPGVKLHWAKDMRAYGDKIDVGTMYGHDNVNKFLEIRKRFDPTGMFANDFMRKLFKLHF